MNWRAILAYYQRLSSRERLLVGLAGGALLVIALYTLLWEPLEEGRLALARRITVKNAELQEMQHMREVYLDLLNQFELRQKIIDRADPKFSLFPHIEATVGQVVGREKITSMNPQNKELGGGAYREESVEIKLTGITLEQLTDLMYKIEKSPQPLRFTRMQVKKRVREPSTFDLTATVSMLRAQAPPAGAEGGNAGA
ncbi:MAG TPA: type II secretion system protein GspM [Candidatus Dormibacteraeota bacterium]|nr:type II secretion system protein GspM [Candidatus Dormibacteraeota bacterium]